MEEEESGQHRNEVNSRGNERERVNKELLPIKNVVVDVEKLLIMLENIIRELRRRLDFGNFES